MDCPIATYVNLCYQSEDDIPAFAGEDVMTNADVPSPAIARAKVKANSTFFNISISYEGAMTKP
jgi:hypothetical protein